MLKFGVISEVDVQNGLARVNFDEDDFVSAPLKMAVARSGEDKVSFPFNVGEHVYCLMDENLEYGVICGAIYDESNSPDSSAEAGVFSLLFGDNSSILYDKISHTLSLNIKGKVNIICDDAKITSTGTVEIVSPTTKITGNLSVTGTAAVIGVVSMGGISGIDGAPVPGSDAELQVKKLSATDDVTAGNVSLKTHRHTSASSGNPTTTPIP